MHIQLSITVGLTWVSQGSGDLNALHFKRQIKRNCNMEHFRKTVHYNVIITTTRKPGCWGLIPNNVIILNDTPVMALEATKFNLFFNSAFTCFFPPLFTFKNE
jgi:hypothetical protein